MDAHNRELDSAGQELSTSPSKPFVGGRSVTPVGLNTAGSLDFLTYAPRRVKRNRSPEEYESSQGTSPSEIWSTRPGVTPASLDSLSQASPTQQHVKPTRTVQDHTINHLGSEGDEYIPREYDEAGERKVDAMGHPLGGRQFRCRTFHVAKRGTKLFMLATECARVLGYRDSYLLFNKNRSLYKVIATQGEKDDLIAQDILPYSYRPRQIAIVTAKSMFRQFGSRLIVNGRQVRDDYWESKAIGQGFTEEDLAGEKRPDTAKARDVAAFEVAHGGGVLPSLDHGDVSHRIVPPLEVVPIQSGLVSRLPQIQFWPSDDVRMRELTRISQPIPQIISPFHQTELQPKPVTELPNQASHGVEFQKLLDQQKNVRAKYLEEYWGRPPVAFAQADDVLRPQPEKTRTSDGPPPKIVKSPDGPRQERMELTHENIVIDDNDTSVSIFSDNEELFDDETEREARLLDPKGYFNSLQELEGLIFEHSVMRYHGQYQQYRQPDGWIFSDPSCPSLKTHSVFEFLRSINPSEATKLEIFLQNNGLYRRTLQWIACRSMLLNVCKNLKQLNEAKYCGDSFNIIVRDAQRANVAGLKSIRSALVYDLMEDFDRQFDRAIRHDDDPTIPHIAHVSLCTRILEEVGLTLGPLPVESLWRHTIHLLDLGILSYAGAHIERFDERYLGSSILNIPVLAPFPLLDSRVNQDGSHETLLANQLNMHQRKLQCLDQFLGHHVVWVFESFGDVHVGNSDRLFLSSKVEDLADIWGPVWKTCNPKNPDEVVEYRIGNGFVVPWTMPESTGSALEVPADSREVFCHWIPWKGWQEEDIEKQQQSFRKTFFHAEDTLLIGADVGLYVNKDCRASVGYIKDSLRRKNALRYPGTSRPSRYMDAHTIQVSGSAMGFSTIGGSITYKRRAGFNLKDTLVERWRHGLRNVADLEAFSGVEVSLCTRNARRRRLWQILGSATMRNFLKANSFEWKDKNCEEAYFRALSDHKNFRRRFRELWADKDSRVTVGEAISTCLDALAETGVDADTSELSALWVETFESGYDDKTFTPDRRATLPLFFESDSNEEGASVRGTNETADYLCEEWIVTLFRSEHTWTGFLRDSPETLTLAVIDKICLCMSKEPEHGWERCCLAPRMRHDGASVVWEPGYSVLQTAILINEDILGNEGLQLRPPKRRKGGHGDSSTVDKKYWITDLIKKNSKFSLGDQGWLTLHSRTEDQLVMDWQPRVSETVHNFKEGDVNEKMLGRPRQRHHQEYIRGDWGMRPLPIVVLSQSTKVRYNKADFVAAGNEHFRRMEVEAFASSAVV